MAEGVGDKEGPPDRSWLQLQALRLNERFAGWLVRHYGMLRQRERVAYGEGRMDAMLFAAVQSHRERHSHPGVVIEVAHEFSPFQVRNIVWEMGDMERLTKAVLTEKMMGLLQQFIEWRKTEGPEGEVAYRGRLIVYRTEDGGKTIIEEAGKGPRYGVRVPGDGAEDTPGLDGERPTLGGRDGSGVLPETPGRSEEDRPEQPRGPGPSPDKGYEYGW